MLIFMSQHLKRLTNRFAALFFALTVAIWPAVVLAQTPAPQPELKKAPPVWLGYLVMFLLLAVVMAISLMPSKRGHQD